MNAWTEQNDERDRFSTDYRERTLKDVITQLEPGLFKKVTGLDVPDFEMLCSLGVFNASLMNDAIFKFKRYEDSSLSYTGIDKHEGQDIGGWDTVLKKQEYEQLFYNQQQTMEAPKVQQPPVVAAPAAPKPAAPAPKPAAPKPAPVVKPIVPAQKPIVPAAKPQPPKPAAAPAQKPEEPDLDYSKIVVSAKVIHKIFGTGEIIFIDQKRTKATVKFANGEKTFVIEAGNSNNAFTQKFLKLADE